MGEFSRVFSVTLLFLIVVYCEWRWYGIVPDVLLFVFGKKRRVEQMAKADVTKDKYRRYLARHPVTHSDAVIIDNLARRFNLRTVYAIQVLKSYMEARDNELDKAAS